MSLPTISEVLKSFNLHKQQGEAVADVPRRQAMLNELFCAGKQWGAYSAIRGTIVDDQWPDDERVPRNYVALTGNYMKAFASLLNQDRRSALAVPTTPDEPEDVYAAEICNRFIDFFAGEQKTADKVHQAVQYAVQDGTAGTKCWYDAAADEIKVSRLTIHDFLLDPSNEDWRQAQWVIFCNHYTEDVVADLWERGGVRGEPPKATGYKNAAGQTVYGVTGYEYWHRPTRKNPQGLFACIVHGEVLERKPYPIAVPVEGDRMEYLLPISLMKIGNFRDSVYGITPITDVINLQRAVNEMQARTIKLARVVTNPQLVLPKSLADELDITVSNTIGYDDTKEGKTQIGWTSVPAISNDLFRLRDDMIAQMAEVMGLNPVTVGANDDVLSGAAIKARYAVDAQKHSDALKSLDDFVLDMWRLVLALVQLHYSRKRQAKIVRRDVVDLISFSAADILGATVKLEVGSELERRTDYREADAIQKAAAGAATTADVANAKKTAPNAVAAKQARVAVATYLAGEDIDLDSLNEAAVMTAIDRAKSAALSTANRADFVSLVLLEKLLKQRGEDEAVDEDAMPTSSANAGTEAPPSDSIPSPEFVG